MHIHYEMNDIIDTRKKKALLYANLITLTITMSITDAILERFVLNALSLDNSIRWVGIASSEGELLLVRRRKDLVPLMTYEENQE